MKNKKFELILKICTAILVFAIFKFTQETQQFLLSFIASSISVIISVIAFKKTFPLFLISMVSFFFCSYMKLFKIEELIFSYNFFFDFGAVMLSASLIWYIIGEFFLIFLNKDIDK